MANITKLYDTPPNGDGGMGEYKKKLFQHRAGLGIRFLICAVVVLGAGFGLWFWFQHKTFTEYVITSSKEHSSTVDTQYEEYNGKLLKYSRDGISCIDSNGEALWSQTYNMTTPVVDICQSAVAVADHQGSKVYVFDAQGLRSEITTRLPIQQISISSQGVTALLLNDSNVSWIYLYDKEGNKLAESRCSLDETGQPLSISLSSDGAKLAVSYLQVKAGRADSCVVFYNFGSVGSNFVDKIVSSKVYEDTLIPKVKYLGSSVCAAVSDQGLIYYEGAEIPEEASSLLLDTEIQGVFFGSDRVGLVVDGSYDTAADSEQEKSEQKEAEQSLDAQDTAEDTDEQASDEQEDESTEDTAGEQTSEGEEETADAQSADAQEAEAQKKEEKEETSRYQILLYNAAGRLVLSRKTDLDFTRIKMSGKNLILYNQNQCEIYNESGVLKYAGTFDASIQNIYKGSGMRKYVFVFSDRTDTVKLK